MNPSQDLSNRADSIPTLLDAVGIPTTLRTLHQQGPVGYRHLTYQLPQHREMLYELQALHLKFCAHVVTSVPIAAFKARLQLSSEASQFIRYRF